MELKNLEEAAKPSVEVKYDEDGAQSTGIPTNTQVQSNLSTHLKNGNKPVVIIVLILKDMMGYLTLF